ncbi:MAG: hypothetical protein DMD52_02025 [Gemmatimonadetes bacterium]|nr:MAG: hypothetical protein DMD52_02025 [Gemmatimonadota bacterium]
MWATSAVLALMAGACHGNATGPGLTPRTALLALARRDTVNPTALSFTVKVNRLDVDTLKHTDAGGTTFAIFSFTPFSLLSQNGVILADTATVTVTVTPASGVYGFTIGPATLAFDLAGRPTVKVSYVRYADRTVYDSASHYADFSAFELALRLWRQRGPDDWISESDAAPSGATVAAPLDAPGSYLVAALK